MAIQDSGSNYQFYDKKIEPNIRRSSFKLDYLNNMTCSQGLLIPYRLLHTMPNSEYNLELESLIRAINVPKVLLQSRQRVFFHEYHVSYQQMWPSWSTFMSKGVSGKTVLPLPKIRFCLNGRLTAYYIREVLQITSSDALRSADSPALRNTLLNFAGLGFGSLADYLGFHTPETFWDKLDEIISNLLIDFSFYSTDVSKGLYIDFSAFPFFAYFSIYRNFYLNWNLNVNDKRYFPDNINDFALVNPDIPSENVFFASWTSARNFDYTTYSDRTSLSPVAFHELGNLKHRNFVDDYFTSALPWPMRGNVPELSVSGTANMEDVPVGVRYGNNDFNPLSIAMQVVQDSAFVPGVTSGDKFLTSLKYSDAGLGSSTPAVLTQSNGIVNNFQLGVLRSLSPVDATVDNTFTPYSLFANASNVPMNFTSGFTWEMIRNLSISTMIAEKMARTNGSYKEFIRTFFDDTPSNQINNVPRYIGGHVQPIVYTEVLQQSSDANTPLGTVGAKGITASDGYIGKCYSNDFGLVIGIMSIMPDTYYSQGLRRQDMYEVQEDFYLPERAELGMQGIYKGELYFSGNEEIDKDLFGYQNRYDEWRYRPNEVHGQLANPHSLSFFPFTQSRYFASSPVLSNAFVSTKNNIRRDYLTAIDEVDFVAQIACRCTAIQPMPYRAIPVGLK